MDVRENKMKKFRLDNLIEKGIENSEIYSSFSLMEKINYSDRRFCLTNCSCDEDCSCDYVCDCNQERGCVCQENEPEGGWGCF